jgi:hypothetical protein
MGVISSFLSPSSFIAEANRMLRALPPSMRTFWKCTCLMVGSRMSRNSLGYRMYDHWSALEKVVGCFD